MEHVDHHYDQLAANYDAIWNHRPEYVDWMSGQIEQLLGLRLGDRIADLGSGTGLFLRNLMPHVTGDNPVLAVDSSRAMLDRLPQDPRLVAVHATAEQFAVGDVPSRYGAFDVITIKEAIHHFADLPTTLSALAGRLAAGGRILVVTLPPRTGYPLFRAADDRFAAWQPEPREIAAILSAAGLKVSVSYSQYPVVIARTEWLSLVAGRWMSVLSSFSDAELEVGLREIVERFEDPELRFMDRFAFILAKLKEPAAGSVETM